MITFFLSVALLLLGYFLYSKLIERIIGVDPNRPTPAMTMADGVDYVPMKPWRIYLIQFLNIAGVGPICGAIMGAQFGTASFLWIVLGSIFAGAVHDFVAGFISLRDKGCSLPEIHGRYLGNGAKQFMRGFTVVLMILVGAVFVNTPAVLLDGLKDMVQVVPTVDPETGEHIRAWWWHALLNKFASTDIVVWIVLIFAYYLIATLVPIDKLIGKIYPVFGILLLLMAVFVFVAFFRSDVVLPELWHGLENKHPDAAHNPIFPMMFISIACGAISGFHATQSPLMARCMTNEKQSRPIFYGAMITEGIVALIWAAAATVFYHDPKLHALTLNAEGRPLGGNAMVGVIAQEWFVPVLATITILGVIAAAITSGDTALRSARLIVADFMKFDQKPIGKRLLVAVPIFVAAAAILVYSLKDAKGFDVIWRYFAWANQVLATVTLWAITVFLVRHAIETGKGRLSYLITLLPALFMTMVTGCFLFVAEKEGLGSVLSRPVGYAIGAVITLCALALFLWWKKNRACKSQARDELD